MSSRLLRAHTYRLLEESDEESTDLDCRDDWTLEDPNVVFTPQTETSGALQVNGFRREIKPEDFTLLQPGDHIGWHRPWSIWHHAIVKKVDTETTQVQIIHFTKKDGRIHVVKENTKLQDELGTFRRFGYPEDVADNPPSVVLRRAEESLSQTGYNIFTNNCEHFATFCKTGKGKCAQVRWLKGKLKQTTHITCSGIVKEGAKAVGKLALAEGVETVAKATDRVGAAGVVALESIHCAYDVYQINKTRKTGEMTSKDFKATVTQRVTEGVIGSAFAIGGSILGSFLGSFIPGIGTVAGAFAGSVIGGAIGNIAGKLVGSIAGTFLGRLWPS